MLVNSVTLKREGSRYPRLRAGITWTISSTVPGMGGGGEGEGEPGEGGKCP
jgi:hypothetical protein